jgi:predicted MPP superfamily phosphohydrolase
LILFAALFLSMQLSSAALPDIHLSAVGDFQCGSAAQQTVNNIKAKNPSLALALGDYSYSPTATCWLNIIQPIKSITKIAIGNHEDDNDEDYNKYIGEFGLTSPYYSFNHNYVHVLVIDTDRTSFSSGSAQFNFVKNDLQAASQNPNIKWIIVSLHKPMYSSPNACGDSACQGLASLRDIYHPLFDQYGVDLVLEGHTHSYQRTYPLKFNSADKSKPIQTSTNKNTYTNPEGQVYAIVGTGGASFHSLGSRAYFTATQHGSAFGILDIIISNDGSKLDAKNYGNDGSIRDTFTITKSNSAPVANNQAVSVTKNTARAITLTASDAEGNNLSYTVLTQPSHGSLTGTAPSLTYTPSSGYTGPDNFTFKVNDGQVDSNTATISLSVSDTPVGGYHYDPSFVATGSNYHEVQSSSSLQIPKFTVAAWFKTSKTYTTEGIILTKGGIGSDTSGQNMNYGLWMTSAQKIAGGFETSTGVDNFVTSPSTYNNGQWHHGAVTYDGTAVKLYVDGVQVGTLSTTSSPETSGALPVRVGANSRAIDKFFTGNLDEALIWNRALTTQEIVDTFNGNVNNMGQVLYLPFSSTNLAPAANSQTITTPKNTAKAVTLTASDPENNPLTYSIVSSPSHGTLTGTAPSVTYTPATDYVGPDSFTFKAKDGNLDSNTATVSISVTTPTDTTPPTVTSTVPTSAVTGVAVDTLVTGTFSEPVQGSTVSTSTFTLKAGTTSVNGGVTMNGNIATFDPSSSLVASTSYTANIKGGSSGVKDTAGNFMTADKTWSFTTASAPPSSCDSNLPIIGVTSTPTQNGFPPTNAIDGSPTTKWWSTFSVNPWIRADLGAPKSICSVDVAWADGNQRQYTFTISVSADDSSYATVFSGKSSGSTTSAQKYSFAETPARYVKITITQSHAGSSSSLAQISELDIFGKASSSSQLSTSSLTASKSSEKDSVSNVTGTQVDSSLLSNESPLAKDDMIATGTNEALVATILDNDMDPDGDNLKILSVESPTNEGGRVIISNSGDSITYYPPKDFAGRDFYSYRITDEDGMTDGARVVVTVKNTAQQSQADKAPLKQNNITQEDTDTQLPLTHPPSTKSTTSADQNAKPKADAGRTKLYERVPW